MQINDHSIRLEQTIHYELPSKTVRQLTRVAKKIIKAHRREQIPVEKRNEMIRAMYHMKLYQKYGHVSEEFTRASHFLLDELLNESQQHQTLIQSTQAA